MKYIKKFEKIERTKTVYWMVSMDRRLEDSIVKLFQQYSEIEEVVEIIDGALNLANDIRSDINDNFVYVKMSFCVDENDEVVGDPDFDYFSLKEKSWYDELPYHYDLGVINIEPHEIDALKYNL